MTCSVNIDLFQNEVMPLLQGNVKNEDLVLPSMCDFTQNVTCTCNIVIMLPMGAGYSYT